MIDEQLKDSTPGLLVDSKGNIYIVAHAGNEGLVLVRSTDKGSSWSSRKTIDEEEGWCLISAVIDSSDNIYVAITSGGQQWIKFYRSTDNGDSWSDTVKITRSKKPDLWSPYIAAGKPGNLVLAWGKYEGGNLNNIYYRYSTDHGKSWSQPQYIAEANSISFGADKLGQFNMVMDYQEGVYFSRSTNQGKSWSNPKYITTGGSPEIKIDSSGILNVLFHSDSLKFFRSLDNGVTWSEQYTVYNYWIFCTPSLAVDNLGNLNVVWIGYNEPSPPPNDTYDGIYYSRSVDNGQNWTDNLDLSNGREIFHGASIAIDKEGTIYIIWGVKKIKDGIEYENVFFTRSTD
ncbi:MAG: exo-alpha-sialidase [Candidatus Aminicenantes bacterium]|nr:MAG: exo-alpha-sialidase [Candidatus Aminicenantes bacterium]